MDLDYHFSKDNLPKGLSYPLKRSVLDAALADGQIAGLLGVSYRRSSLKPDSDTTTRRNIVLRADYCGESRCTWAVRGGMHLYVYAIVSRDRKNIEVPLVGIVLPKLVAWLRELETAPPGSTRRGVDQYFEALWTQSGLVEQAT